MSTEPEQVTALAELETPSHFEALTPKQVKFVHALVWRSERIAEAAKTAGLGRTSAYRVFAMPAVRKAIDIEIAHLRASKQARAIQRLEEISEQDESRSAAFQASRYLAGERDDQRAQVAIGIHITPGYVLDLAPQGPRDPVTIDGRLEIGSGALRPGMPTTGNR